MDEFAYFQTHDGREWEARVLADDEDQPNPCEFVTFTDDYTVWADSEHNLFATRGGLFGCRDSA